MAKVSVLGGSPVTFVTDKGNQVSIPLSALFFQDGALVATGWSGWATHQAEAEPLLKDLTARGVLRPSPEPPPVPAMVIKARDPGSTGNQIRIQITKAVEAALPKNSTVDMTVVVEEVYPDLTKANVVEVLGTTANGGSRPGMAFVKTPPGSSNLLAVGLSDFGTTGTFDWTAGPLTLSARRNPGVATPIKGKTEGSGGVMTLTLIWQKSVTATKLTDLNAAFDHVLEIAEPSSGWGVPSLGMFFLKGGSDVAAPTTAQAAVLSV